VTRGAFGLRPHLKSLVLLRGRLEKPAPRQTREACSEADSRSLLRGRLEEPAPRQTREACSEADSRSLFRGRLEEPAPRQTREACSEADSRSGLWPRGPAIAQKIQTRLLEYIDSPHICKAVRIQPVILHGLEMACLFPGQKCCCCSALGCWGCGWFGEGSRVRI
jgi:hypothetical protein